MCKDLVKGKIRCVKVSYAASTTNSLHYTSLSLFPVSFKGRPSSCICLTLLVRAPSHTHNQYVVPCNSWINSCAVLTGSFGLWSKCSDSHYIIRTLPLGSPLSLSSSALLFQSLFHLRFFHSACVTSLGQRGHVLSLHSMFLLALYFTADTTKKHKENLVLSSGAGSTPRCKVKITVTAGEVCHLEWCDSSAITRPHRAISLELGLSRIIKCRAKGFEPGGVRTDRCVDVCFIKGWFLQCN